MHAFDHPKPSPEAIAAARSVLALEAEREAEIQRSHAEAVREQERRHEHERRDLLRRDLRDKYITAGLPEAVSDRLFEYAWEEGHPSGNHEVERIYADLKDIVNAAFKAGSRWFRP